VAHAVRIRYPDADATPLLYTNNFYINHSEHEFIITLAEVPPPPVLHMTEKEISALEHVNARIVARIAMSPSRFREFVRGAVENYNTWSKTHGDEDEV
jgi:hypothetical protein